VRKVYGIPKLIVYLTEIGYPLTEEEILSLMKKKTIPHLKPFQNMVAFNLDHIDGWVSERTGRSLQ